MPYAITVVPVMPLRAEPSHKSEMISQATWGECVEIRNTGPDNWIQVKCQYDGYEGWVTVSHLEKIDRQLFDAPYTHFLPKWINTVLLNGTPVQVPYGALIKHATTWGTCQVHFEETHPLQQPDGNTILRDAFLFRNTAYLWGGKTVFGADCSGLCQTVFKTHGLPLLRDAYQQATQGTPVDFLQEARPGDLAFFDNAEGKITHVGILLNEQEIIHASGKVRIDAIDNQGIINSDTGQRTHALRIIKRYY